ncbi:MAG TPA: HIT family protein [Comamonas denitrificans]|nr:HIT family protein [Comamonas denitrificans]
MTGCVLCQEPGGQLIWQGEKLRLIRADEAGFPAFYRIVWNAHVAEFSDLAAAERQHCMDAVALVEQVLRQQLQPTKINLATLGNVVPHLHWHIIARYDWDSHFPAPVWASAQRPRDSAREAAVVAQLPMVDAALQQAFAAYCEK